MAGMLHRGVEVRRSPHVPRGVCALAGMFVRPVGRREALVRRVALVRRGPALGGHMHMTRGGVGCRPFPAGERPASPRAAGGLPRSGVREVAALSRGHAVCACPVGATVAGAGKWRAVDELVARAAASGVAYGGCHARMTDVVAGGMLDARVRWFDTPMEAR